MTAAIHARDLHHAFDDTIALAGVDVDVPTGTVLALLGPNGAGKTTTVRVLTTQLVADRGDASVMGVDVRADPAAVRRHIGMAGQYAAVDERLTGRENLELVARLGQLSRGDARRRARELLDRFSLTDAGDRPLRTYSGGMRRRIDLAAALVGRPPVLFLDEPTTGLDPRSRGDLWAVIEELVADGTTVLLTTQYLEEADRLADTIAVVDRGRVVARGTADELKATAGSEVIRLEVDDDRRARTAAAAVIAATPALEVRTAGPVVEVTGPDLASRLPTLVAALDAAVGPPRRLDVRRPTLDDVFLRLTGHLDSSDATTTAPTTPVGA